MGIATMRKLQKINQVFPITNGLFNHMNYTFRTELSKSNLDVMFVTNYGKRNIAPVVEYIQGEDNYGEELDNAQLTALAGIVLEMYREKWDKLGRIYDIDYDPIHNYLDEWNDRLNENGKVDSSGSGSKTYEYGKIVEDTGTRRDTLHSQGESNENTSEERTDDLVKTEERNLNSQNIRSDDLKEEIGGSSKTNRRDDFLEITEYGRKDTRSDEAKNSSEGTSNSNELVNDNNQVYAFNSVEPSDTDSYNSANQNSAHNLNEVVSSGNQSLESSGNDARTNSGGQSIEDTTEQSRTNTGTRTDEGLESGSITTSDEGTVSTSGEKTSTNELDSVGLRENNLKTKSSGEDSVSTGDSSSETRENERNRLGRHFGNIGNLTSQKQILEEINLWKWNYMNTILEDVKEFCTLPVYLNASEWQLVNQSD